MKIVYKNEDINYFATKNKEMLGYEYISGTE